MRLGWCIAAVSMLLVALPVAISPAIALDLDRIAGHTVELRGKEMDKTLVVDGRVIHSDRIILFDDLYALDGTLALVGESSGGGNACDASPFVLSFPEGGGAPRLDGPLENCMTVTHSFDKGMLLFATPSVPGKDMERWQWMPDKGFQPLSSVAFAPDAGSTWESLRERKMNHPVDAFRNAAVADTLKQLLGPDFAELQNLMTGVGEGHFTGDDFAATACRPHACDEEGAILFLSSSDRKAYVAWKPAGKKIVVYPSPVKTWPEKAKAELRTWAKQW